MPARHGLQYLMDQHVVSAAEAAYVRIIKVWTPSRASPLVLNNSLPTTNRPEEWMVHHAEISVVHATGYVMFGYKMAIIDVGPPGFGGLYLAAEWQGGAFPAVIRSPQPVSWGIGWALYPTLVAGDVVIFRCKYEVRE